VFTDNGVLVREDGVEAVYCSRGDGMGVSLLRARGVPLLILSKERNPVVTARAKKLKVECLHDGPRANQRREHNDGRVHDHGCNNSNDNATHDGENVWVHTKVELFNNPQRDVSSCEKSANRKSDPLGHNCH